MIQKPQIFSADNAEPFQQSGVVAAYRYRPPYPDATFDILIRLMTGPSCRVLDAGCGTGAIARRLVEHVEQTDAVDFSRAMIEEGKRMPNGGHPNLNWLHGRIEDVALAPPYALVVAGASLHWMDWNVVLPRFREVLSPGGYLAIASSHASPGPWSLLHEIIPTYRTDGDFEPYDMFGELGQHGLFHKVGEEQTAPVAFTQSVDECIESYHSRSGFARERMGAKQAAAFDRAAHEILLDRFPDGLVSLEVVGNVVWGLPG